MNPWEKNLIYGEFCSYRGVCPAGNVVPASEDFSQGFGPGPQHVRPLCLDAGTDPPQSTANCLFPRDYGGSPDTVVSAGYFRSPGALGFTTVALGTIYHRRTAVGGAAGKHVIPGCTDDSGLLRSSRSSFSHNLRPTRHHDDHGDLRLVHPGHVWPGWFYGTLNGGQANALVSTDHRTDGRSDSPLLGLSGEVGAGTAKRFHHPCTGRYDRHWHATASTVATQNRGSTRFRAGSQTPVRPPVGFACLSPGWPYWYGD